ncbi:MAG: hypothetical protein VYE77_02970, partial [Planctomycetota bacterium]|nr:hypothetical protein [Planctomycetota bacterium]
DNEFARSGILDSLRIRNPLYRLMFRYFTWIARLGSKGIWLVLGAYMGFRILRGWMQTLEGPLRVVVGAVVGLYVLFALSTWLATPMGNVALFFHPLGRMALTRKERWTSAAVAGLFVASLCLFATAFVWGLPDLVVPALQAMMSSLVVAAAGPLLGGRFAKVGIAAVVASLAALGFLLVSPAPLQGEQSTDTDLRLTIFPLSCLLTLAFLIGSQFLAQAPHRR